VTTTSPMGMTFVQAAEALAGHLSEHQLPEPALLGVQATGARSQLRAQLCPLTVAGIAAELLIWADTLGAVTIEVWRVAQGERVQLSITSTLPSPTGGVELDVYGDCFHDPSLITDLPSGGQRTVTLDQLRSWAASTPGVRRGDGVA
jgi:hypothetical protein